MNLAILYSPWFTSMAPWLLAVFSSRPARLLPAAPPPQAARHVPPPASCRLLLPRAWASLRSSLSAAQEGRQTGNTQEHATQGRRPLQPGGQPLAPARYGLPRCGQRTAVRLLTGDGVADRGRRYGRCLVQLLTRPLPLVGGWDFLFCEDAVGWDFRLLA